MDDPPPRPASGMPYAIGAYTVWGLLPLYLMLLHGVPPFEFVGWRIVFTLPVCLAIVALRRQGAELVRALRDRRIVLALMVTSVLIGGNWLIYIAAVVHGHVYAASLGYYINPLLNILIGTVFLGERLSRAQWVAVALATVGVFALFGGALTTLWISLSLASTFAIYGLIRRLVPIGSVPGLTIESAVLYLPACAMVWYYAHGAAGSSYGRAPDLTALLTASGAITAFPLLMFAVAARRLDLSVLGFVQFLSPTLTFILGLTVFHEELKAAQIVSFVMIWAAIAVFSWDLLARRSKAGREA